MALGRPQNPYRPSFGGAPISDLYKTPNSNIWKVVSTGKRFRENDERKAILKFYELSGQREEVTIEPSEGLVKAVELASAGDNRKHVVKPSKLDAPSVWAFVADQILKRPEYVARMTGIPELARLADLPQRKSSIPLATLRKAYLDKAPGKMKGKNETINIWDRMVKFTKATTLAELTTEKLMAWCEDIKKSVATGDSQRAYFSRIKRVIAFGLKVALDAEEIGGALLRCKVLWSSAAKTQVDPRPISREAFHALLNGGNGSWRAWLLLSLNLCLHLDECCNLKWREFNLENGTFATIRGKTAEASIPRAAVLWPETIEALKGIKKRGESPWIFTSSHGKRYNRNTRGNDFAELRDSLGLSVKFDDIRDGAFTAACRGCDTDKWARILAGHAQEGYQANYVLVSPEITKPACEAVYAAYGPFPAA